MTREPAQTWWTAEEIASAALPDMPGTKRRVNAMAERFGWRGVREHARRRGGRGGGWEYHWKLFPLAAQKRLLSEAEASKEAPPQRSRDEAWEAFDALPESAKAKARQRLEVTQAVAALEGAGRARNDAVKDAALAAKVSARSVWNWLSLVEGVAVEDHLAFIAPRHRTAKRLSQHADCDPKFKAFLWGDYLRLSQPSFSTAYRRAVQVAKTEGWATLPERTMRRRLNMEVSRVSQIYLRKGAEALKQLYPAQTRDRTAMQAMEAVNADYHKWDVFVNWPVGHNHFDVVRPQMVAFQDVYSGRILSWRVSRTPNKSDVALTLGDMISEYGIPEHMLLDNGKEFANKFLTGQAQTRYRFKIKDDDIPGILKTLGIEIHWATPYSGQSKLIERAFRDLCDSVAKDPRFEGAYTGNTIAAKPENHGSRAIELEEFLEVVAAGIDEYNQRTGRRSKTAEGRSLAETFDASYARAPIRKATDEQKRLWLMGAEGVSAHRSTGLVKLMGNEYWSPWMHELAGRRIVARFDPEDLTAGLHIYGLDGAYLGHAETKVAAGFFDVDEARSHAAARNAWRRSERERAKAIDLMKVTQISAKLNAAGPAPNATVEAKVMRPVFDKPAAPPAPSERSSDDAAKQAAFVADFASRKAAQPNSTNRKEEDRQLFQRAMEIEERLAAGQAVGEAEERWLKSYQTTPAYAANKALMQRFGKDKLG